MLQTVAELDVVALEGEMTARGWKLGRAGALLRVVYSGEAVDAERFGEPVARWANGLAKAPTAVASRHTSPDGTVKLLVALSGGKTPAASGSLATGEPLALGDSLARGTSLVGGKSLSGSESVECVLMPTDRAGVYAGCVSSQVGCAMGCDFCASTLDGVKRNLSAEEIVGQFFHLRDEARRRGGRLGTLVFMGMGEPMMNLDAVIPAIRRIADKSAGQLGYKNVQVSTVGIVPGIERLATSGVRVGLALSLHGPDDATRSKVVPVGRRYTVAATLDAAWAYQTATGRVSNIEYCLLAGENDSPAQAQALAEVLAGRRMHVNLIPHNPIGAGLSGTHYHRPSPEAVAAFLTTLRAAGVAAHVRKTRGDDTAAACGQLRRTVGLVVVR